MINHKRVTDHIPHPYPSHHFARYLRHPLHMQTMSHRRHLLPHRFPRPYRHLLHLNITRHCHPPANDRRTRQCTHRTNAHVLRNQAQHHRQNPLFYRLRRKRLIISNLNKNGGRIYVGGMRHFVTLYQHSGKRFSWRKRPVVMPAVVE